MKRRPFIEQRHVFPLLAVVSAFLLITVFICGWIWVSRAGGNTVTDIVHLKARSQYSAIILSWNIPDGIRFDVIELKVESDENTERVSLPRDQTSYVFSDGIHGKNYQFCVRLKKDSEYIGEGQVTSALFLNWEQLPDLPIITIETLNGIMPTCSYVSAPEGAWGQSISDNEYVWTQISIEDRGTVLMRGAAEIRIRGNTSAYAYKKPYKLKLEDAADLLFRGDDSLKDREWLLIPDEHNLRLETGMKVSELCGLEWQPAYQSINLIMNGDWMGTYHLIESVKQSPARVDIGTSGFLIENDAYWWNEDGAYFQTPKQNSHMGYTFCYPTADAISEAQLEAMYNFISDFERALFEGEGDFADYIDIESFSAWLLLHDVLGTWDAGGSNMYLYKDSMEPGDPFSSKLKLGPAWDFSTIFSQSDDWATIHNTSILYYTTLMKQRDFSDAYKQNWYDLSGSLTEVTQEFMDGYLSSHGQALQESWDLDVERWNYTPADIWQVSQSVNAWFSSRTDWLNTAIGSIEE